MTRTGHSLLAVALCGALCGAVMAASGCRTSECARANYSLPECRVIAENEFAHARLRTGVELRFEHPLTPSFDRSRPWEARGVIYENTDGITQVRVATLGDFAISMFNDGIAPAQIDMHLSNVDDRALVTLQRTGETTDVPALQRTLARVLHVELAPGEQAWVRGRLPCPSHYRIVALGDIQTNPLHFERILDRISEERDAAELAGEPLLGVILLGDLSETSAEPELRTVLDILARAPVPVATIPGNHDIFAPWTPYYNRLFGPGNYAFSLCQTKVALFDTGNGSLADSILMRLQEFLQRDGARDLIAAVHHPAFVGFTGSGWTHEDHAQMLLGELVLHRADVLLTGHVHALLDEPNVAIGKQSIRQVTAGTAGALQGLGLPTYGYVRLRLGDPFDKPICFVEVPPPGSKPGTGKLPSTLHHCPTP